MNLREYAEDELSSLFLSRLFKASIRHSKRWWHFLLCWSLRRDNWFRVSISCLLDISPQDNQHLLISSRGNGKEDCLEPIGGVVKYTEEARQYLDAMDFQPEGGERDLRLRLRGAQLPGFIRWFETGGCREPAYFTIHRELDEELRGLGFVALADSAPVLQLRFVRTVEEWPSERFSMGPDGDTAGANDFYFQYRRHYVFRPVVEPGSSAADWLQQLIQQATTAGKAALVSKAQILSLGGKELPREWKRVVPSAESFVRGAVEKPDIARREDQS